MLQCRENERGQCSFLAAFSVATTKPDGVDGAAAGFILASPRVCGGHQAGTEIRPWLHPPFPLRPESAVQALQYLAGRDGGFLPGGMTVGQFLALVFDLVPFGMKW